MAITIPTDVDCPWGAFPDRCPQRGHVAAAVNDVRLNPGVTSCVQMAAGPAAHSAPKPPMLHCCPRARSNGTQYGSVGRAERSRQMVGTSDYAVGKVKKGATSAARAGKLNVQTLQLEPNPQDGHHSFIPLVELL